MKKRRYTVKQWLTHGLPHYYSQAALRECAKQGRYDISIEYSSNLLDALHTFRWARSREGANFWRRVYSYYKDNPISIERAIGDTLDEDSIVETIKDKPKLRKRIIDLYDV